MSSDCCPRTELRLLFFMLKTPQFSNWSSLVVDSRVAYSESGTWCLCTIPCWPSLSLLQSPQWHCMLSMPWLYLSTALSRRCCTIMVPFAISYSRLHFHHIIDDSDFHYIASYMAFQQSLEVCWMQCSREYCWTLYLLECRLVHTAPREVLEREAEPHWQHFRRIRFSILWHAFGRSFWTSSYDKGSDNMGRLQWTCWWDISNNFIDDLLYVDHSAKDYWNLKDILFVIIDTQSCLCGADLKI